MKLTLPFLLFVLQIKNIFGECGYEKDINLQLSQLLMNSGINKQINSLTTAKANPYGFSLLNGQAITNTNGLSNDIPLVDVDFNNLLHNMRKSHNINRLPVNDAINFKENRGNNILKLKNNMASVNGGLQQNDYIANPFLSNYFSSPLVNNENSNYMPIKDSWSNNIQLINAVANMDIPTNQNILNYKPLNKNQYANIIPCCNSQQGIMTMLNDLQNRNTLTAVNKINPLGVVNRNIPISNPGLSNDGNRNSNFMNMYPTMTDIDANSQYSTKHQFSMSADIPIHINNGKESIWFLDNGVPARNKLETTYGPGSISIYNDDLSFFNNPLNCKPQLEQLSRFNKQFPTESSLLNIIMSSNKTPTNSRFIVNKDNIQNCQMSKLHNLQNCNIVANGNIMPSQLTFANSNDMPIDSQIANIDNLVLNNVDCENFPIISNIDRPQFSDYVTPVISNLPLSDTDLYNSYKPVYLANTNVLNLGEFGSLPIINGLPLASIVETVTVLNPNYI